jgi:uracil-DNA glycosylase
MNQKEKLKTWYPILKDEFDKDYMKFIGQQLAKVPDLCPHVDNVFKAYELTPPEDVKVVILGQDPYPGAGMAHGLSFSTLGQKMPASLRIIFDELVDSGLSTVRRSNKDLTDWAEQGVLMLNSVLTTKQGQALAHGTWGWQNFTGKTLEYLMNSPQPIIYMVWGKSALGLINSKWGGHETNIVLQSCHPAAQLYGGSQKFIGNKHFIKANDLLVQQGLKPIVWDSSS